MNKEQAAVKATYFSIIGNTCLAIIKGLAGFLQFYALIADAIESTTDILRLYCVIWNQVF
jgi:divalent metal cation (Fe/Co/Zn/Cd) transporter